MRKLSGDILKCSECGLEVKLMPKVTPILCNCDKKLESALAESLEGKEEEIYNPPPPPPEEDENEGEDEIEERRRLPTAENFKEEGLEQLQILCDGLEIEYKPTNTKPTLIKKLKAHHGI